MREILFRGKRIDNGEWVEGWYQPPIEGTHHDGRKVSLGASLTIIGQDGFLEDVYIISETVGQFTGLTDKNGKKIFEGDIVTFKTRTSTFYPMYVRWYDEDARFIVSKQDGVRSYPMDKSWEYEIIGNIHDNPELLEVTDNA